MSDNRPGIERLVKHCADSMHASLRSVQHEYDIYMKITGRPTPLGSGTVDQCRERARLLTAGAYMTEFSMPDLEALDAQDRTSEKAWEELHNAVSDNITSVIMFNLEHGNKIEGTGAAENIDWDAFNPFYRQFEHQLLNKVRDSPHNLKPGERISVIYEVDDDGDVEVVGVGRVAHTFTIDIPDAEPGSDDYMLGIAAQVQDKVIEDYVHTPKHPFYRFWQFGEAEQGDGEEEGTINSFMSEEDQEKVAELGNTVTEQIANMIASDPELKEASKIMVKCEKVTEDCLLAPKLDTVLLEPNTTIQIHHTLSDTEALSEDQRDDWYEVNHASELTFSTLRDIIRETYSTADFSRYAEALQFMRKAYMEGTDDLGMLVKAQSRFRITKSEAMMIEHAYDSMVSRILEGMERLDNEKQIPFYLELQVNEGLDLEGLQEIELKKAEHVCLEPGSASYFDIELSEIPGQELTEREIEANAREITAKVANYVFGHNMREMEHPLLYDCFENDPEKPDATRLSERGAEEHMLGSQIRDISAFVSDASLQARYGTQGAHFSGIRLRFQYAVDGNNRIELTAPVRVTYLSEDPDAASE